MPISTSDIQPSSHMQAALEYAALLLGDGLADLINSLRRTDA
ncbi:hypothetical protein [Saccharothrix sp. ALI-22-I]|nr:hypothetical protein [Saccharothrix sp. ALI-22-I]